MRNFLYLVFVILLGLGCSTSKTSIPPAPKAIYPPTFKSFAAPSPPGTNSNQGTNFPIVLPPYPQGNGPAPFITNFTPYAFVTNGNYYNLSSIFISNLVSGHSYTLFGRNNSMASGPITLSNGWSALNIFTATNNTCSQSDYVPVRFLQRYYAVQDNSQ